MIAGALAVGVASVVPAAAAIGHLCPCGRNVGQNGLRISCQDYTVLLLLNMIGMATIVALLREGQLRDQMQTAQLFYLLAPQGMHSCKVNHRCGGIAR